MSPIPVDDVAMPIFLGTLLAMVLFAGISVLGRRVLRARFRADEIERAIETRSSAASGHH